MENARMIFRDGDAEEIWGIPVESKIIDESELEVHLADGWHMHPHDVRDARAADAAAETEAAETDARAVLLTEAELLGLPVDNRWGNKRLAEEIAKHKATQE